PSLQVTVGLGSMEHGADVGEVLHASAVVTADDANRVGLWAQLKRQLNDARLLADGVQRVLHQLLDQVCRITAGVHSGEAVGADGELDRAVGQGLLGDGATAAAGFELSFFAGIRLEQAVQLRLLAPPTTEVVELHLAAGGVEDHRILPARELHDLAAGRAAEQ